MIFIHTQSGKYAMAIKEISDLKCRILRSKNAETDEEYWVIEIEKAVWRKDAPLENIGITEAVGIYREREDAVAELLRLKSKTGTSTGKLYEVFQFKESGIHALEIVNMTTPFI